MTANDLSGLLPLVLIVLVGYLLVVRPMRARQREAAAVRSRLQVGSSVITTAGLFATVVALDEQSVTLETSPGVASRWLRAAIGRIVDDTPGAIPTEAPPPAPHEPGPPPPPDHPGD